MRRSCCGPNLLAGLALFQLGDTAAGLSRIEAGLAGLAETHSPLLRPFYLIAYAEALVQTQRLDAAETLLCEAQETSRVTSQRVYDPELHRVWGELHSTRGDAAAAERDLLQAISLADQQGAFWHRFRAAAALARLLVEHGRASDASHVLHPALAAISADESCPEVASARALLAATVS